MQSLILLALTIAISSSGVSIAQQDQIDFQVGNGLLVDCTSSDSLQFGLCMGYIQGVQDGAKLVPGPQVTLTAASHWCQPDGVTRGQIKDVVVKYLRDHPETRQEPSFILVANAMVQAWPCSK